MTESQVGSLRARSRIRLRTWDLVFLLASISAIVALAWIYLFTVAIGMAEMSDTGMPIDTAGMQPWKLNDFLMMFAMWVVMMIGMMVPTAARAISIYARIANSASNQRGVVASTCWFVTGYVLVWTMFSLGATLIQMSLATVGLLSPAMVSSSGYLGATLLIAAGAYQITPWKNRCLTHCRSPATYLAGHFGPKVMDGIVLGVRHGGYCLGCCWLLMALLFIGGVMNLLWIAAISGFVILEKLLPAKLRLSRLAAALMIGVGTLYLVNA